MAEGISNAIAQHDDARLFEWLLGLTNFQGVSDKVAVAYLGGHSLPSYREVADALALGTDRPCPKLKSFEAFTGCGYRKLAATCNEPALYSWCAVPRRPLRNGRLTQAAYSLLLFLRDDCGGDLVDWIDATLTTADQPGAPDRAQRMREAILSRFAQVHGVGRKIASMALRDLLLGGDPVRERWRRTGEVMVVVDRLVHNFLHRTGILMALDAAHAFGPACYRPIKGCAAIIEAAAGTIDARTANPAYPAFFPAFVQYAVWSYCATGELNICNGLRIDDRDRCRNTDCHLFAECGRVALKPAATPTRGAS